MDPEILLLNKYIVQADIITFFGGAGVSTESGFPDYRSKEGRYTKMKEHQKNPQNILNRRFILNYPEGFFNIEQKKSKLNLSQIKLIKYSSF